MVSVWSVLKLASRAAIWRTTPDPQPVGLPSLLIWIVVLAALRIALQFVAAGPGGGFNPYGLNAVVAWLALEAAVAALFMPPAARTTALSAMFALLVVAELAAYGAKIRRHPCSPRLRSQSRFGADRNFCRRVALVGRRDGGGAAQLRVVAGCRRLAVPRRSGPRCLAVNAVVPHAPVFVGRDFDIRTANRWESLRAKWRGGREERMASSGAAGLRTVAAVAAAGGNRRSSAADERRDQRLRARHRRLGGPGCFPQGAGRRIGGARRCPADQRAYAASR